VLKKQKNLPSAPKLISIIGPSFILLGLALGSGELILWPYLSANYGLGLIWGAILGIGFQFFLNMEVIRYALCWGESVFVGLKKLSNIWPIWFIISTFIPWSLPGFSSASAEIIARIFQINNQTPIAIFFLVFTGLILTIGKTLYKTMELLQKLIILVGLPLIFFLTFKLSAVSDWQQLAFGFIGKGSNWWFFPAGVAFTSFLGAFAYSGAGGNLNLAQSYYVKEKGLGMGKFGTKITSILSGKVKKAKLEGVTFPDNAKNKNEFKNWWRLLNLEHFLVFFCLGLITIIFLSVLAKTTVFGQNVEQGISFLYKEGAVITNRLGDIAGTGFLLIAALMLYSTQLGVLESSSRIISENLLLLTWQEGKKLPASLFFYLSLWGQIILGIIILSFGITEPRFLLTLGAILNALAMTIAFPAILLLNLKKLKKDYQPKIIRKLIIFIAFCFFLSFSFLSLK